MKIIEQSHEVLRMDGLDVIERAGRTCYKSGDKIGCAAREGDYDPDICDPKFGCDIQDCAYHSSHKFVRNLIKRGHEAMLEHGTATVKFITNRGVTHELVRHRLAAFAQESTRYVKYDGNMEFIRPVWCKPGDKSNRAYCLFTVDMVQAEVNYNELLACGWPPEQAREVLPNALKTEIVVTANYREWRHIFNLRALGTTGRPHPQMQALMLPVLEEFKAKLPTLFEDLEVK